MELEFDRDVMEGYQVIADDTICQEETMEAIVPDACPDILHITAVCGQAFLNQRQAREGLAWASGAVRAVVLYRPEEGGGLRRMEVALPFSAQMEAPGLTEEGAVHACVRIRSAEARALNPRKVLVRAEVAVELTAFQPWRQEVCQSVREPEEHGVQQLCRQEETYHLCAVEEKPFHFGDQIRCGGEEGAQLVCCRVIPVCRESKRIGSRLIFKGTAEIQLLTQQPGGALTAFHESRDFSQVMELPALGEGGDCHVSVEVAQLCCQPGGEDGRTWEVDMDLVAQAQVWCRRPLTLVQDLYSTGYDTQVEREEQRLGRLVEAPVRSMGVRELLETGSTPRTVLDSWVTLGQLSRRREGEQLVLEGEAGVTVLCLDDGEEIQAVQRTIPINCRVDAPQGARCFCRLAPPAEVYAAPTAGGVEARFTAEVECLILQEQSTSWVRSAALGETRSRGEGEQPSVVLRLAAPGEGLWELAKAYGTTTQQILQANELEEEELPSGRMLLIPSAR